LKEGLTWLGVEWSGESYTSDRMDDFYTYCDEMFVKYKAYVCTCPADAVKKGREEKKACDCTAREPQENMTLFRKMREGKMEEGEAVVRFRGDMHSDNTVMRDPTLFRIIKAPHYRQGEKYKCWPSYDFVAPIMDSTEGITHAMRTKEYELRNELYFAVLRALDLRPPSLIEFSRLSIKGAPISKRLITPLIEQKKVEGWDDPRLPTLKALARKGILPEAVKTFVLSFGLTKVESEPTWDALLAENRKILDERSMRRYFVRAPVNLMVDGAPGKEVEVPNHPKNAAMGKRKMSTGAEFWIAGTDAEALAVGETFRLKELYNLVVTEKTPECIKAKYDADEGLAAKKIQWVPVESAISCKVKVAGDLLDESGSFRENSMSEDSGYCEASCRELSVGDIVQFERYGYARMDKKEEHGLIFIFSC